MIERHDLHRAVLIVGKRGVSAGSRILPVKAPVHQADRAPLDAGHGGIALGLFRVRTLRRGRTGRGALRPLVLARGQKNCEPLGPGNRYLSCGAQLVRSRVVDIRTREQPAILIDTRNRTPIDVLHRLGRADQRQAGRRCHKQVHRHAGGKGHAERAGPPPRARPLAQARPLSPRRTALHRATHLYPTPHTVSMGSAATPANWNFLRIRRICSRTSEASPVPSQPHTRS